MIAKKLSFDDVDDDMEDVSPVEDKAEVDADIEDGNEDDDLADSRIPAGRMIKIIDEIELVKDDFDDEESEITLDSLGLR